MSWLCHVVPVAILTFVRNSSLFTLDLNRRWSLAADEVNNYSLLPLFCAFRPLREPTADVFSLPPQRGQSTKALHARKTRLAAVATKPFWTPRRSPTRLGRPRTLSLRRSRGSHLWKSSISIRCQTTSESFSYQEECTIVVSIMWHLSHCK